VHFANISATTVYTANARTRSSSPWPTQRTHDEGRIHHDREVLQGQSSPQCYR
jgi:hypothetical protein